MATTNYNLKEWATGDALAPADLTKPNRVADRAVHFTLDTILADGRYSGALIQTNKRIAAPGQGMINGCAWEITTAYEVTGTCQAGSTDTQIKDTANLTEADHYWVGAWVFAESGVNDGEYRQVTAYNQTSGTLTVGAAFTAAFTAGDSFRVTFIAIKPDTLTDNIVNYIYGRRVTYATQAWTTEAQGILEFYASSSSTKPAGEIYLGTITLNVSGVVTNVDNDPSSDVDSCYALEIRTLRGTTAVNSLAGGASTQFYVTHSDSLLPGAFTALTIDNANFTVVMNEYWENDRFRVTVTNTDSYAASAILTWRRVCLIA
jgi:hypothetical protein